MNRRKIILLAALALSAFGLILYGCARESAEPSGEGVPPPPPADPSENTETPTPEKPSPLSQTEREQRRISITDGKFTVDGGSKPIWINGANTPWNKWNDFGGGYNDGWWDNHLAALRENGVNAIRVWINCNNDQNAVLIGEDGVVSGVSEKHWADLDLFFATAERNGVYVMATLLSFDHFKSKQAGRWRLMVQSDKAVDSYIEHYTLPFIERYQDNPYLWSIDLMNEPDWVHEDEKCGKLAWEDISRFFARNAAAIRKNSPVLVTVGMAFPKYNADGSGYEGNKVSDAFLQTLFADQDAKLDFWSPHYYDWVGQWYGVPFTSKPHGVRSDGGWGLDSSKPAVLAEHSANGSAGSTLIEDYTSLLENGWQGAMPWTSNGVDGNGGFEELIPATRHIAGLYPDLVFPLG
ncbi:MAG: cellulase family glycosylhydrolase [Oscillospiraceae bacterium]|nr:cellulase family glycosylhydrolase [Oscillospiraceae bacterium]